MRTISRCFLSALLGCFCWLSASSGAQAALYQRYQNGACASNLNCFITFPLIPAGKTLQVTNVSCYLRVIEITEIFAQQLLVIASNGTTIISAVTLEPRIIDTFSGSPSKTVYSANHTILAFATAGQRFRASSQLRYGNNDQFSCHISGHMTP